MELQTAARTLAELVMQYNELEDKTGPEGRSFRMAIEMAGYGASAAGGFSGMQRLCHAAASHALHLSGLGHLLTRQIDRA